jgi:hypothetical protein
MDASAGSVRIRSNGSTSPNRSTNSTSHISQVGASRVDFGSWYSLFGSNWVGSGNFVREIRTTPAAPDGVAFEW